MCIRDRSGTKQDGWYIDEAKQAMADGKITYAGKYSAPDYETIYSADCNLAIENTMIYHTPEVKAVSYTHLHITVKGGKFLEAVAQADTIVFDKTGTLTHACPVVARVIPFGGRSEDDMLRVAACLEEHFPHSMANAVVRAARERNLAHEEMHSQVEYIVAHGISSMVENKKVVIGSAHSVSYTHLDVYKRQEEK